MLARESRKIFARIEQMVAACPTADLECGVHRLRIGAQSPSGFDMSLAIDDFSVQLTFDRWWLRFARNDQRAIELFEQALHGDARIRVDAIGAKSWKWTLERRLSANTWVAEQAVGALCLRFWGTRTVTYLQNDFGFAGAAWMPATNRAA